MTKHTPSVPPQYSQGDILIEKIGALPTWPEMRARPDGVILNGEVTGHAHRLDLTGGNAKVLETSSGNTCLVVLTLTSLVHEEHDTIMFPKGT